MSLDRADERSRVEQEPRSSLVDAEPRRHKGEGSAGTSRKDFVNLQEKEIERMIDEGTMGESLGNKGTLKAQSDEHLPEHVGYQANADND